MILHVVRDPRAAEVLEQFPAERQWDGERFVYDEAVEAGYVATLTALDKLSRPIPELRRRQSLREQQAAGAVMTPFMASTRSVVE